MLTSRLDEKCMAPQYERSVCEGSSAWFPVVGKALLWGERTLTQGDEPVISPMRSTAIRHTFCIETAEMRRAEIEVNT